MKQIELDQIMNSDEPDRVDFQVLARGIAEREEIRTSYFDAQRPYFWDDAFVVEMLELSSSISTL